VVDHPGFTRVSGNSHRVLSDGGEALTVALDGDHDGLGRPRSAGKTSTHFGEIVNAGALSAATRETSGFALGSSTKACITFCAQSDFGSAPILREAIGGLRKTRHRGRDLVEWFFVLTAAAYNLIRIPKLLPAAA
jgi:hypothetical protein